MKKFLKDLENELKKMKINDKEIKEILADHEEMMKEALNEGLSEEELTSKFGNPAKLAKELLESANEVNPDLNEYVEEGQFGTIKGYKLYKTFQVSELKEINVKLISEDFELYPFDGDQIEVHFKKVTKPEKYEISLEKGIFELKRKKGINVFSIKSDDGDIVVRYPKLNKLDKYTVETVSGDCLVKGVDTDSFKLKSISGDFEVTGVVAGKSELSTVSGDFELLDMKLEEVSISAVSGDFEAKDIKVAGDIQLNTVSGDFEFYNVTGNSASLSSVSGDIVGKEFYVESVDLKSVSGDIEIENEDKTRPINVGRKKSLSGDIKIS